MRTDTVTVYAGGAPNGIIDQLSRGAESLATSYGLALDAAGHPKQHGHGEIVVVVSPEHDTSPIRAPQEESLYNLRKAEVYNNHGLLRQRKLQAPDCDQTKTADCLHDLAGAEAEPVGAIPFAGEHTSGRSPGTLGGAVSSGERTAREVLEGLRVTAP